MSISNSVAPFSTHRQRETIRTQLSFEDLIEKRSSPEWKPYAEQYIFNVFNKVIMCPPKGLLPIVDIFHSCSWSSISTSEELIQFSNRLQEKILTTWQKGGFFLEFLPKKTFFHRRDFIELQKAAARANLSCYNSLHAQYQQSVESGDLEKRKRVSEIACGSIRYAIASPPAGPFPLEQYFKEASEKFPEGINQATGEWEIPRDFVFLFSAEVHRRMLGFITENRLLKEDFMCEPCLSWCDFERFQRIVLVSQIEDIIRAQNKQKALKGFQVSKDCIQRMRIPFQCEDVKKRLESKTVFRRSDFESEFFPSCRMLLNLLHAVNEDLTECFQCLNRGFFDEGANKGDSVAQYLRADDFASKFLLFESVDPALVTDIMIRDQLQTFDDMVGSMFRTNMTLIELIEAEIKVQGL